MLYVLPSGNRKMRGSPTAMIDIQNQKDDRNIDIKKVGVKGIKYPITVLDRVQGSPAG